MQTILETLKPTMDKPTKKCCTCKRKLPLNNFWCNKSKSDGHNTECKFCSYARVKKWRETETGKAARKVEYKRHYDTGGVLKTRLRSRYNISVERFNKLFTGQNGVCAICETSLEYLKAAVDHNHETGKVRGLLCNRCNALLSGLDDKAFFRKAVVYLAEYDD